jgi:uncharacterized repeat protein (TIGR02543 family)
MLILTVLVGVLLMVATVAALADPAAQRLPTGTSGPIAGGSFDEPDINNPDKPPLLTGGPAGDVPAAQPSSLEIHSVDFQSAPNAPIITVWNAPNFNFGSNGDPQKWINILGNVNSGAFPVVSLAYTVNGNFGGSLNRGPDTRRLTETGDFILEIDYTDLQSGNNEVVITATDSNNVTTTAPITINYTDGGNAWPAGTYTYSWQGLTSISPKAHIVTGEWALDNGTVRPVEFDYDRLIALGDLSWKDYTVTVPITVFGIDESGYEAPSFGPGVGFIVRWQGHFATAPGEQPRVGWRRLGALGWYHWYRESGLPRAGFQFIGHTGANFGEDSRPLVIGKTYNYKIRVQSNPDPSKAATYSFKVWDAALTEPATWDFSSTGLKGETKNGSVLLVAHHVDATFGTVTVELDSVAPPPILTTGISGTGTGSIAVVPNKTTFRFGEDATLTATAGVGSTFTGWTGNVAAGEINGPVATVEMMSSRTVRAAFNDPNKVTPISDDFSACALDESLWTFINPLDDATLTMTGTQARIDIPAGASHDYWVNNTDAPRLMQPVANKDFSFDVKFESPLSVKTQIQGVIVEQDENNWLRYSFQSDGSGYKIVAHTRTGGSSPTKWATDSITVSPPMYLRVQRVGNDWTLRYSDDGATWTTAATYTQAIITNSVGVFAGNVANNNAPATTVLVDYFFNTSSPISPEDPGNKPLSLALTVQGEGTADADPQKTTYACGEQVTVTATPQAGWRFAEWQGDLTGSEPVKVFNMIKNTSAKAVFVPDVQVSLTVMTSGQGSILKEPNKPAYSVGEQVKLTAQAELGHAFTGWTGDVISTSNPVTVTMDTDKTITGNFAKVANRTLTTSVPGGGGTIEVTPEQQDYLNGSVVMLMPVAESGYVFAGWGGDLAGQTAAPYQLVMDADKNVTATFKQAIHALTVTENPAAGGDVIITPQKPLYFDGETVTLEAVAAPGYIFLNWTGVANSTANPATVIMDGNKTVTANFVTTGEFSLTTASSGPGQIAVVPNIPSYAFGDVVTMTATADPGYAFIGWSGDLQSTANPGVLTMTKSAVVTATFTLDNQYTLTVTPEGPGQVTTDPERGSYAQDQLVVLRATPDVGFRFVGWSGDLVGTANPATVKMTQNTAITATFEEAIPVDLTIEIDPPAGGSVSLNPQKDEYLAGELVTMTAKAAPGYFFSGWQGDAAGNSAIYELLMDGDKSVVATFTTQTGVVSDDFNSCDLDPTTWQWVDPNGQAQYQMTGTQLTLFTPPGENYNLGDAGNFAARMMQPTTNTNLGLEVKMDSQVFQQYQFQGILLEQDADNYIYFQFFHNGTDVRAYAGSVTAGVLSTRVNETVQTGGDIYLRVIRTGDVWRMLYSSDGVSWIQAGRNVRHVLTVSSAGLFGGSHSRSPGAQPGHEAIFDYFFDIDDPISPEDPAPPAINTSVVGSGSIELSPNQAVYACGEEVTLTAVPAADWEFAGWSGDVTGNSPSVVLRVMGVHDVIATFTSTSDEYELFLPAVLR